MARKIELAGSLGRCYPASTHAVCALWEAGTGNSTFGDIAQAESELKLLKISALRHRALAAGLSEGVVDAADDADDPKDALVALVLTTC